MSQSVLSPHCNQHHEGLQTSTQAVIDLELESSFSCLGFQAAPWILLWDGNRSRGTIAITILEGDFYFSMIYLTGWKFHFTFPLLKLLQDNLQRC